jgi:lipoprotein signal peptidase
VSGHIRTHIRMALRRIQGERRGQRGGGRRRTDFERNRGWMPAVAIALVVAVLDWTTKAIVARRVPLEEMVVVWEGRLAFWHVKNPAMILGLYGNLPLGTRKVIAVLSAILAATLLLEVIGRGHRLPPNRRIWAWIFVGLSSGGMLGNLGERAWHWGVTDFLSLGWGDLWLPPGNVADLAIFLSIPLAFVVIAFELQARAQRRPLAEVRLAEGSLRVSGD